MRVRKRKSKGKGEGEGSMILCTMSYSVCITASIQQQMCVGGATQHDRAAQSPITESGYGIHIERIRGVEHILPHCINPKMRLSLKTAW